VKAGFASLPFLNAYGSDDRKQNSLPTAFSICDKLGFLRKSWAIWATIKIELPTVIRARLGLFTAINDPKESFWFGFNNTARHHLNRVSKGRSSFQTCCRSDFESKFATRPS
jgi:hypothetical protein